MTVLGLVLLYAIAIELKLVDLDIHIEDRFLKLFDINGNAASRTVAGQPSKQIPLLYLLLNLNFDSRGRIEEFIKDLLIEIHLLVEFIRAVLGFLLGGLVAKQIRFARLKLGMRFRIFFG